MSNGVTSGQALDQFLITPVSHLDSHTHILQLIASEMGANHPEAALVREGGMPTSVGALDSGRGTPAAEGAVECALDVGGTSTTVWALEAGRGIPLAEGATEAALPGRLPKLEKLYEKKRSVAMS